MMEQGWRKEGEDNYVIVGARQESTCIKARKRGAVGAQLWSLEPTPQRAAGGQERRSGNP